jgi:predicted nucleic acid-binding protein
VNRGLLLDTSIISELRRARRNPGFNRWWQEVREVDLHLSVLTLGEIDRGVEQLRSRDGAQADTIAAWCDRVRQSFGWRVLEIDEEVARCWGQLSSDRSRPVVDTLIAATAKVHDLTLVTRNVTDFEGLPITLCNPFTLRPDRA